MIMRILQTSNRLLLFGNLFLTSMIVSYDEKTQTILEKHEMPDNIIQVLKLD